MARVSTIAALSASLILVPCLAGEPTTVVVIHGPTAIGVFPPVSKAEVDHDDGGLREGMAHVQFALEDLEKCLSPRAVTTRFENTRSVTIRDGSEAHVVPFARDWQHAVGIVIVTPGRPPLVVLASAGPSSLLETAPQAASRYFSEPKCKRYEE